MTAALIAYATYVPRHRLAGSDVGLRRGDRVVASYDEDSTTMAVAAASRALDGRTSPANLYFATSSPAYADKTNASAIHAALGLPQASFATDLCGTGRSGFAAWRAAAATGGLALTADVRVGRPGSADERLGGDGAAALLFGEGSGIADVLATTSHTAEFLDRWRSPRSVTGEQWEERFGADRYSALIRTAVDRILDDTGLAEVDHVVLACPNGAVTKRVGTLVKALKSTRTSPVGFSGVADAGIALASVLDVAEPDETILVISAFDGCDAVLLRTTAQLPLARQSVPVSVQREQGIVVPHLTYLSWHGLVELEPPRRPEPDRPAAPPAARGEQWKFGFTGTRCRQCEFVHLPPARVCRNCGSTDEMDAAPVAALHGTIVTHTVDHLAYSPSPPMIQAVLDVDGGGRCTIEVTDAEPEQLRIGARVAFTFRRLFTSGGVHDYFWKSHLLDTGSENNG
ncbi:hydroxymethylglutaryl-CoA synthase [Mycolicibacterium sp. P9-64]|uniref:OB-fold domain-containing protein n=1 Tax=Mycolicibacterium sp. P9-64 TaxID=2024612 RepID=UPI0011EFAD11|nr:OB-fold domain-containing protein [Mycolicibacterium sp. P9-64]KAA0080127.1 hydroxymethylglutaryl-CoA synthase [Mycolicibacterium sp. P9-64]